MPPRRPPAKRDPNDLTDLRGGLYVRVSEDPDKDKRKKKEDIKKYITKQTEDQKAVGLEWADRVGVRVAADAVYSDPDYSASRFATQDRPEFERLLRDIKAGKLDVVWFWELSRSQRDLKVFAKLRDLCRDMGVLWVIRDRVYDPSNYADMMTPAILSVMAESESEQTSLRVQRGKQSSAHTGRPPGKVPYGYKRIWNQSSGKWERDIPNVFDGDGLPVEDTPAYIVKEIFDRLAAGDSITGIRRDLNDRGIRTQQGYQWDNSKIRYIAMSPTYIGQRVYQVGQHYDLRAGERTKAVLKGVEAGWPPLVDPETWWAVQRILTDPARRTTRFGPRNGSYLLSSLAWCAECGGKLLWKKAPPDHNRGRYSDIYYCKDHTCVGIGAPDLDDYAERVIVRWLSDPQVAADLTQGDDSAAATQARVDRDQANVELQQLHRDVKAGAVSPTIATIEERRLLEVIAEAEQRVKATTLPAVLRDTIGPQAKAGWDALDLAGRRLIVRTVADIRVKRVGRGRKVHPAARVKGRWLLGDGADWPTFDPDSV